MGQQTLSFAGDNIGNPNDPRKTQSNFQRAGIALSCPNNLLFETCYLMIILDPKSYYHAFKDPRWQAAMDEEMNSLKKNTTWELVSLPLGRKLVQCVGSGPHSYRKRCYIERRKSKERVSERPRRESSTTTLKAMVKTGGLNYPHKGKGAMG